MKDSYDRKVSLVVLEKKNCKTKLSINVHTPLSGFNAITPVKETLRNEVFTTPSSVKLAPTCNSGRPKIPFEIVFSAAQDVSYNALFFYRQDECKFTPTPNFA